MKNTTIFILLLLFGCINGEDGSVLGESDIKYIKGLKILDEKEVIYKFYSEYKKRVAGNFFTDKRIATYWIDERNKEKNEISTAFYSEIKSIDTFYNAGVTFSPYMLVRKEDGTAFKVSVNGNDAEINSFFTGAINEWHLHRK